jgi:hypothetical protein
VKALAPKWNAYLKSQHSSGFVALVNCAAAQADTSKTQAQIAESAAQYASQAEIVHTEWTGE